MKIVEALEGMEKMRFVTSLKLSSYVMDFRNGAEIDDFYKREMIHSLAKTIISSEKAVFKRNYIDTTQYDGDKLGFSAEVFVFNRKELEQLICNVEIKTRESERSSINFHTIKEM